MQLRMRPVDSNWDRFSHGETTPLRMSFAQATRNESIWDLTLSDIQDETSLAPRGRSFLMASQNDTIWDQQWNRFSLASQNESF